MERYNLANIQLDRIEARAAGRTRASSAIARVEPDERQLAPRRSVSCRSTSNGGEPSALEVVLGAESLDDLMDRLDTIERVGSQDARVVGEVRTFGAR